MEWFGLNVQTVLLFLVIFILCYFMLHQSDNLAPQPHAWPLLGNVPYIFMNMNKAGGFHKLVTNLSREHGPIIRMGFKPFSIIVINTPDVVKEAFVQQAEVFANRPYETFPEQLRTEGVVSRNGQEWKDVRRLAIMTMRDFGVGKSSLEQRIQEEARYLTEHIRGMNMQSFSPTEVLNNAVSNIICSITFGRRYDYDDAIFQVILERLRKFVSDVTFTNPYIFVRFLWKFPLPHFMKELLRNREKLYDFVQKEISQHSKDYNRDNLRDVIDVFLKAKEDGTYSENSLSDRSIKDVIMDLFLAGTDTTTRTLEWTILYLMAHPEVQDRCHQELDNVIGMSRLPNMSDRTSLPYIEATLLEVQRMITLAPFAVTHEATRDTVIRGCLIPKGSLVIPNIHSVHYDPVAWGDPETFRPERWIDSKGKVKKLEAFIPFSLGPRICPGENLARMEIFVFMTALLQNFTFHKENEDTKLDLNGNLGLLHTAKPFAVKAIER